MGRYKKKMVKPIRLKGFSLPGKRSLIMKIDIPSRYLDSSDIDNSYNFEYKDKIYTDRIDVIK